MAPRLRRELVSGAILRVGDTAGQCLPVTAERIRAAIIHGTARGGLIAAALTGAASTPDAPARYRAHVPWPIASIAVATIQTVVTRTPERLQIGATHA